MRSRAALLITEASRWMWAGVEDSAARRLADLELFRRHPEVDLDLAVHHADRVGVHPEHRGKCLHLAGPQIEARAVPRALHQTVLELALTEHTAVVRADVVDGAPGAVLAVTEAEALALG